MPKLSQKEIDIFRSMSPEKKIQLTMQMYHMAWELKYNYLRSIHPEWDEERIKKEIRKIFAMANG